MSLQNCCWATFLHLLPMELKAELGRSESSHWKWFKLFTITSSHTHAETHNVKCHGYFLKNMKIIKSITYDSHDKNVVLLMGQQKVHVTLDYSADLAGIVEFISHQGFFCCCCFTSYNCLKPEKSIGCTRVPLLAHISRNQYDTNWIFKCPAIKQISKTLAKLKLQKYVKFVVAYI